MTEKSNVMKVKQNMMPKENESPLSAITLKKRLMNFFMKY